MDPARHMDRHNCRVRKLFCTDNRHRPGTMAEQLVHNTITDYRLDDFRGTYIWLHDFEQNIQHFGHTVDCNWWHTDLCIVVLRKPDDRHNQSWNGIQRERIVEVDFLRDRRDNGKWRDDLIRSKWHCLHTDYQRNTDQRTRCCWCIVCRCCSQRPTGIPSDSIHFEHCQSSRDGTYKPDDG